VDVQPYLDRIRYQGPREPNLDTLHALHQAHLLAVPFENLDIPLGKPIILEEERLFDKIVTRRRGGFCYELNGLFATLLRELGFEVERLAARVANERGGFGIPFDHMTLLVRLDETYLADVGFGESFREPLRLREEGIQQQPKGNYRISYDSDQLTYLREVDRDWKPQYIFSLQPYELADFQGGCNYHQTSPASSFTQKRICSLATPEGRITLSDMKLLTTINGRREERVVLDDAEYSNLLRERFGVVL
jgi:N-hydroxyarylamine O-acetyltransferase